MTKEELDQKIREHIRTKGEIIPVEGIFGDDEPNLAYVEEYVTNEKGIQTKFYGCSFLYKGNIDTKTIDSLAQVKRTLIATLRLAIRRPWLFLIKPSDVLKWFDEIYQADLGPRVANYAWSPFPRELLKIHPLLACIAQFDSGYTWRMQDFTEQLTRNWMLMWDSTDSGAFHARTSPNIRKQVNLAFDVCIGRDNRLKDKWRLFKRIFNILWFTPLRKTIGGAILGLASNPYIGFDEADRYFAYRRHGYNVDGLDYETRIVIVKKIDEERGHAIII